MIHWTTTTCEQIKAHIPTQDPTGKQLRMKGYERATASLRAAEKRADKNIRTATITVAEGQTLELPTLEATPGLTAVSIVQKKNSKLILPYLQNLASTENGFAIFQIELEEGAELECYTGTFGAAQSTLILETTLTGAEARLKQHNIFFGNETQNFEIFSTTYMRGINGRAQITAQGALHGTAHGRFDGGIVIEQTGHGCDGQLEEEALLLSSECKIDAIPRLKIDTNDVTAGHSAAITRVDDEQLFYAASRGIPEEEAIHMIAEGFMQDAYANMPFASTIKKTVEAKLDALKLHTK
ncbi:hypothetical protein COV82_00830 [Candidatus Peregrinibacteria bacterium CG11_big_fil_rev_8_21_14_0_20_46_8]|nr:MAG: hypothetical protein COV82_00830 [Candidatus Peregrinibacteria bacterium CG11_big_fil_rev_8_21_14_0_20_46_8]